MTTYLEPKTSERAPPPALLPANNWPAGIVVTLPPPTPYAVAVFRPPVYVILDRVIGTGEWELEELLPLPDEPPRLPPPELPPEPVVPPPVLPPRLPLGLLPPLPLRLPPPPPFRRKRVLAELDRADEREMSGTYMACKNSQLENRFL